MKDNYSERINKENMDIIENQENIEILKKQNDELKKEITEKENTISNLETKLINMQNKLNEQSEEEKKRLIKKNSEGSINTNKKDEEVISLSGDPNSLNKEQMDQILAKYNNLKKCYKELQLEKSSLEETMQLFKNEIKTLKKNN